MLKLSEKQMDAIRNSELRVKLAAYLENSRYLTQPLSELVQDNIDCLSDACIDVLTNEAPGVEEFTAEQDVGRYYIGIRGVPGAYFVFALIGVFSNLAAAGALLDRKPPFCRGHPRERARDRSKLRRPFQRDNTRRSICWRLARPH